MATVSKWTPYGVALNITATSASVTRKSATQYTVKINASWKTYYSGARTMYGMTASSGGGSVNLNTFGTKASSGSGSFTGTYSISGNGSATKTITVTFKNYNSDNGDSATKTVSFTVTVPAWTSYAVKYNANGGSGAPSSQTKWKDQTLTLSSTKPTRTGYSFQGWGTSASDTSVNYAAGASYTANAAITLYAIWKANTYTVKYDANGGSGAPSSQTKTYGVTLTLSSTVPTRKYYNFLGWSTSKTATSATYSAGGSYTANSGTTLYAVWELAYVRPRINNLTVNRCNSDGHLTPEGTYAKVSFDWTCDYDVSTVTIQWAIVDYEDYQHSFNPSASGTSGSVSIVIGSELSVESSYKFKVTVTDTESTSAFDSISGSIFTIDGLVGGRGVAFGKKAQLSEVTDSEWPIYARRGFLYPSLEKGVDLNSKIEPGVYYGNAATTYEYVNCPITTATSFTLEVFPAGDSGQIMQRITSCSKTGMHIYHRFYYNGIWQTEDNPDWIQTY